MPLPSFRRGLARLNDALCRAVIVACGLMLVALIAAVGWQVYGRYVLNDTPTWTERAALLLDIYISLLVGAVGIRERFHMSVLAFVTALPAAAARVVERAVEILLGCFGLAMAWYALPLIATGAHVRMPLIGLPQSTQYLPLCASGVMTFLFSLEQLLSPVPARGPAPADGSVAWD